MDPIKEDVINGLCQKIFNDNAKKGFWDGQRNKGEMMMLIVSEVAEMLEAIRKPEPQMSAKIPMFSEEEEELADAAIRIFDYAAGWNLRLGEAIIAKLEYNRTRPFKHGKTC